MRPVPLTAINGIDRQRPKGDARADHLYDFVNGYRTAEKTGRVRHGTFRAALLPPGTHGLTAFNGKLHVFASSEPDDSANPIDTDRFEVHILLHPSDPLASLERIHFAEPFLGALYVVAEFDDGGVFHYWLQRAPAWQAEHEYAANELVSPTTPNGHAYRATRLGAPYQAWAPGVPRTVGDKIEPTAYNEYYYEAVATEGDNPRSGGVEPIWPTNSGERIVESADDTVPAQNHYPTPPAPPPPNTPQTGTQSKYGL